MTEWWIFTEDVHLTNNEGIRISDDGSEHVDEIFHFFQDIGQNDVNALFCEGYFL